MILTRHATRNTQHATRVCVLAWVVLLAATFFGEHIVSAQTNSSPAPLNYESFRIISQRNIFDPNRSPRIARNWTPQNTRQRRTVDAFSLVGTMSYEKGKFAFFDGTQSQFQKVVEPGANIAGYTVKDIAPKSVILAANGKEFQMKVGTQMRNEGENVWKLSDSTEVPVSSGSESNGEAVATQAPPTGASPEMNDVLKKMMERRNQELK